MQKEVSKWALDTLGTVVEELLEARNATMNEERPTTSTASTTTGCIFVFQRQKDCTGCLEAYNTTPAAGDKTSTEIDVFTRQHAVPFQQSFIVADLLSDRSYIRIRSRSVKRRVYWRDKFFFQNLTQKTYRSFGWKCDFFFNSRHSYSLRWEDGEGGGGGSCSTGLVLFE